MYGSNWILNTEKSLNFVALLLLGLAMLMPIQSSAKSNTKLDVGFWGPGDHSCDSARGTVYYVGGIYDITVKLLPDGKRPGEVEYTGISDWTWPKGLVIAVGKLLNTSDTF